MAVTEAVDTPSAESVRSDAELVVDVCMSVEKDDVVTIITDDEHEDQARVVADVCVDRGAWPVIMNNETQVRRGRADTHFPMAPPRNLHQAMVSSDEIIIITNLEWANRFAHVSAVKESCANNAKIASVEPGMGSWGLTVEALHRAQQRAWDAMAALEGVENATVIGEFAFGVSEVAPFGTPSEKGRVGTVHLALGDNHNAYPGGQNVSVLHLDGVVLEASMQIVDNGRWILKDGQWVL